MAEWYDNQKKAPSDFCKSVQEQIEKTNPRLELRNEEANRLNKLESTADKLKRWEKVQTHQLQTWLSEDKYTQLEYEW